ncbi:formylglycine-generating enzyme family protein [Dokdonella sp.]|uniref:SUMF1/EgtB/PvdO family nonheme iron enzyme n=1 Tax=Dokdonella sp. TaxID=2291710 RepID=UPI00261B3802|nr:formylglycine-generating enzyme family protein [Dokdonella sp.]
MPGSDATRKQNTLGGIAGMALLAFALAYRFFPGLLHIEPAPEPVAAGNVPGQRAPTPWSATPRPPQAPVEPKEEAAPEEVGTSFADAVRMGPPAPTSKEVAALLARARTAEEKGALLDPKNGAIVLYRAALAGAEGNLEAVTALERIGGAMRDWTLAAIERGDEAGAQRYLATYADLPHSEKELDEARTRLKTLHDILPMLTHAAELMKAGRVTEPAGDNALAVYRKAAALDPGNRLVDAGLAGIERGYLDDALKEAAQDNFEAADQMLGLASSIRPGSQALLDTRARIESIRRQRAETVLAQASSALDSGNADLAEELAKKAQAISADLAGLDDFSVRLRNARLYASLKPGQVIRDAYLDIAGTAPALVVVPTGQFVMGSPADEPGHADSEEPQRRVRIEIGFALGQSEVTVAQFREFVRSTKYVTDAERFGGAAVYEESTGRIVNRSGMTWQNDYRGERASDELPVVNVSWNDAQAYLAWLSARTGKKYRLPSEAEFEYALRAGSSTRYPWGDGNPDKVVGNFTGEGDRSPSRRSWSSAFPRYSDGYWGPAPVKTFPPDAYGLYDMEGNVSEWVEDCWHDNYVRAPRDSKAWVNPGCERRVVRGGSWGSDPDQVRSAFRLSASADARSARVGFRLARDL